MPVRELGKTTLQIVCHLVAPKAKLASLKSSGTFLNASSTATITTGNVNTDKVAAAHISDGLLQIVVCAAVSMPLPIN